MFIPGDLFAPATAGIEPSGAAPLSVAEEVIGIGEGTKVADLELHAVSLTGMAQMIGDCDPGINALDQSTFRPAAVHIVESIRGLEPGVFDKAGSSITMG